MGKLVRTIHGTMIDLALDIRMGSKTFGQLIAYEMVANPNVDTGQWIWIPPGFAHGNMFATDTTIEYLCTAEYVPTCQGEISPLASDIDWSLCDPKIKEAFESFALNAIMSAKDRAAMSLGEWEKDERSRHSW